MAKLELDLRERGSPAVVPIREWSKVAARGAPAELERMGIVATQLVSDYVIVQPKTHVGFFDSELLSLRVNAKAPELERRLRITVLEWRRRVRGHTGEPRTSHADGVDLVATLRQLLSQLYAEGMPWTYTPSVNRGSPKGRILFGQSIRTYLSKGIAHRLISASTTRTELTRLVAALHAVLDRLVEIGADKAALDETRPIVARLGERGPPISRTDAGEVFREALGLDARPALHAVSTFGLSVLNDEDLVGVSARVAGGVAEFIDMEKLWELALGAILEDAVPDCRVALHPLRSTKTGLFADGGPNIDPDVWVIDNSGTRLVADAKYSVATSPNAADIYQLTCYAERLNARAGLLAYVSPTSETQLLKIGTTSSGKPLLAIFLGVEAFSASGNPLTSVLADLDRTQVGQH